MKLWISVMTAVGLGVTCTALANDYSDTKLTSSYNSILTTSLLTT
jgi:hypothetical protein